MTNKTIFLFLLSLMIYGTVSVNAQVRIGGNSVPHPSSVLDLNPDNTDTATASGGLLLPHVRLNSVIHAGVFGAGITPTEGLMVYNVNNGDADRPEKGVYCYMGGEWVPVGAKKVEEAVPDDPNEPDYPGGAYTGPRFSIAVNNGKGLWFGRDCELIVTVDVKIPSVVTEYGYPIQYVWDIVTDTVTQQITTLTTVEPRLQIPAPLRSKFIPSKLYPFSLTVRIYDFETAKVPAGNFVYGIGAWIGPNRWLTVANANAGATQTLSLEQQLRADHAAGPDRRIMGNYFQWGRVPDGHEVYSSNSHSSPVPVSMLDPDDGQPTGDLSVKFITSGNFDWREYPENMTVEGNIKSTNEFRKPWYWRTPEDPVTGSDPCGMDEFPGEWFVMTRSHWDSITAYNRTALLTSPRGMAIYPNEKDSDKISFYLPGTAFRDANHGYLGPDGWVSSSEQNICLWLNSPAKDNIDEAYCFMNSSIESQSRAAGFPVRCVSY